MRYSKRLHDGAVCQIRGDKVCLAGSRTKHIAGVWQSAKEFMIRSGPSFDAELFTIPEGLVVAEKRWSR